jgi:5-methylcytosine-specific restriction endonuclease McrA
MRDRMICRLDLPGCTRHATHVDHVVPLSMGGAKYDDANCQAACMHCNLSKGAGRGATEEPPHRKVSSW